MYRLFWYKINKIKKPYYFKLITQSVIYIKSDYKSSKTSVIVVGSNINIILRLGAYTDYKYIDIDNTSVCTLRRFLKVITFQK